jgi:hypothetical protein
MLFESSILVEAANLYKLPKERYPMISTVNDNINNLFNCNSQYKKKKTLIRIRKETPRLTTANIEKVLGGKNGKIYERNRSTATTTFI